MGRHGKGHQASKHKTLGTYIKQFARTVARTGRWRGKPAEEYKKHVRKKKRTVQSAYNQKFR